MMSEKKIIESLNKGLLTCVSAKSDYFVKVSFRKLEDAQELHRILCLLPRKNVVQDFLEWCDFRITHLRERIQKGDESAYTRLTEVEAMKEFIKDK
jgi:hypothetical protein